MEDTTGGKLLRARGLHIWQIRAFFGMGTFYLFYYFCKYNLGVATPDIQEEFGISSKLWGLITTTIFTLVYAGGQFVNGFLGDRYGPKRVMIIGGLGGVIVTVCFGLSMHRFNEKISPRSGGVNDKLTLNSILAVVGRSRRRVTYANAYDPPRFHQKTCDFRIVRGVRATFHSRQNTLKRQAFRGIHLIVVEHHGPAQTISVKTRLKF